MNSNSIQELIDRLRSDDCTRKELQAALRHPAAVVRANAIEQLARQADGDDELIDDLRRAAVDPTNQTRLMGTMTVGHVAVAALLRIGNSDAERVAHEILNDWPEPDRQDLLWYLQTEGLLVAEPATGSPERDHR